MLVEYGLIGIIIALLIGRKGIEKAENLIADSKTIFE